MKKLIKVDFDNTTRERKTEDSYSELYSYDKNNGSFEFEILNDTLTTEQVIALFKFTESNKIWKTTGTVEGNKVNVTFDTTLITQNETVICYLYFDEEQRTSDTFRFKFKVKVSEIDKMNRYEVKERFINNTVIVDRLDVVTKDELKEALKNVGGIATDGLLTEVKAEETYAKKSEAVDNTNFELVKNRVLALELKTDKDTVYDDTEVKHRLTELENKPVVDTSVFVTEEKLASKGYLTQHQSLDNLVTKEELNSKGYLTNEVLNSKGYLTEEVLNSKNYLTEDVLNTKNYLTQHQDLSSLVTKQELENKHFLTEHQTLTHLATNSDLEALRNVAVSKSELSKKLDTTEFNTFKDNVVTKDELAGKGYLTEHQNLDEYAKKSELGTAQSNQTLTLNNNTLSITGGNSVELPVNRYEIHGTGMPNGVVEAEIGTTYVDKNKTNGAFKWIKTTNGGNQGWEVLTGDTGWRQLNISSKLTPASLHIRRVNNMVTYQFGGLSWGWFGIVRRGGEGYVAQPTDLERNCYILNHNQVPEGFRTPNSLIGSIYNDNGVPYGTWYIGNPSDVNHLRFQFLNPVPTDRDIGDIRVSTISYFTNEPWPVQLP